jgi:hypothetical protein
VFVDRILKGVRPGDIPIEHPTKFQLLVNMKTAKSLRIAVPESVLLRADELIRSPCGDAEQALAGDPYGRLRPLMRTNGFIALIGGESRQKRHCTTVAILRVDMDAQYDTA